MDPRSTEIWTDSSVQTFPTVGSWLHSTPLFVWVTSWWRHRTRSMAGCPTTWSTPTSAREGRNPFTTQPVQTGETDRIGA